MKQQNYLRTDENTIYNYELSHHQIGLIKNGHTAKIIIKEL